MTTSVSHEIKNVLAIINENAGLLEDFILMEQRGMPIDSERLKKVTDKVKFQVKRADIIIKNLNRFGHSTDVALQEIELSEFILFFIELSNRQASNKGVALELADPVTPVKTTINPFLLLNLIWLCFNFLMDSIGDDKIINIEIQPEDDGKVCIFFKFKSFSGNDRPVFPAEEENALLDAMNAALVIKSENPGVVMLSF